MSQFQVGLIKYKIERIEKDGFYYNKHIYTNNDHFPEMHMEWKTISKLDKTSTNKEFKFSHSEISLIKNYEGELKTIQYEEQYGRFEMKLMKIELLQGYLHSFKHPALYIYENDIRTDENYYLFNRLVNERDWKIFRLYFEREITSSEEDKQEAVTFFDWVIRNDRYGIYNDLKRLGELSLDTKEAYHSQWQLNTFLDSGNFSEGYKRLVKTTRKKKLHFR